MVVYKPLLQFKTVCMNNIYAYPCGFTLLLFQYLVQAFSWNRPYLTETAEITRRSFVVSSSAIVASLSSATRAFGDAAAPYDSFSSTYDDLDGGKLAKVLGIEDLRHSTIARARGKVLEVAFGTGLNLPSYPRDKITSIDAIDLSAGMLAEARAKCDSLNFPVNLQVMDVEHLAFPDATFDTVVDTFSLCVFNDPIAALSEMRRVLKPTGRVLLLENSRSELGPLAAYQDITAKAIAGASKGCVWNQNVEQLIHKAGLKIVQTSSASLGLFRAYVCAVA